MASIGFTVTDITHPEPLVLAYQAAYNADPDGDSDGTGISMARPVPTPMFIADLDGTSAVVSGSEWQATLSITVLDAHGQPVAAAEVYGDWSYDDDEDCTTDGAGQCDLSSSKLKLAEVSQVTFSVTGITHPEPLVLAYQAAYNTDPDGDSDGTAIVLDQP
jgi:hypothetical protein